MGTDFQGPDDDAAAIDRMIHHSVIIELNQVSSYRLDQAKKEKGSSLSTPDGTEAQTTPSNPVLLIVADR